MSYFMDRKIAFQKICEVIAGSSDYVSDDAIAVHGDSLEKLANMPSHSVSLILTDPPYHSTKKKNITGDTSFKHNKDFIDWMRLYSKEWFRILKPNGSLYMFCSSQMSSQLEVMLAESFKILSNIVWTKPNDPGFDGWKQKMKKEALRQWYPHSERIIFAAPAQEGNLHKSYFGNFLRMKRLQAGLSGHQLTEMTGAYGKVNHGGAVSNWETGRNIPSRRQYQKICDALLSTGRVEIMPLYEDVIRPFSVNGSIDFTDVWTFPSVRPYRGKHPAEKPLEMLEHIISSSSFEGDIVLDCFAGSGSTAIASIGLNRKAVAIEIEEGYFRTIEQRVRLLGRKIAPVVAMRESTQFSVDQHALFELETI